MTPELFATEGKTRPFTSIPRLTYHLTVRGTACGSASALSRMYVHFYCPSYPLPTHWILTYSGGITAPLIGGPLVALSPTLTVITSVAIFLLSAILLFFLDRALVRAASTTGPDPGGEGPVRAYTPIRVEGE